VFCNEIRPAAEHHGSVQSVTGIVARKKEKIYVYFSREKCFNGNH